MLKTVSVSATHSCVRNSEVRAFSRVSFPLCKRLGREARLASPGAGRRLARHAGRTQGALASFIVAGALAFTALLAAVPADARAASSRLDRTERNVIKLINSYRARHGRAGLRASGRLSRVADRHSFDMVAHGFFAHASRNGTAATTRVRRSSGARGAVGENIAFLGADQRRAARGVIRMWIASARHRAVLLHPSFRRVGIGRRGGSLRGARGSMFTADFAAAR